MTAEKLVLARAVRDFRAGDYGGYDPQTQTVGQAPSGATDTDRLCRAIWPTKEGAVGQFALCRTAKLKGGV